MLYHVTGTAGLASTGFMVGGYLGAGFAAIAAGVALLRIVPRVRRSR